VTERNLNFNHLTSRHSRRSNTHWHFGRFWRRMMGRRLSCCVKAFLGNDPTQPRLMVCVRVIARYLNEQQQSWPRVALYFLLRRNTVAKHRHCLS
jgi:hypothetical protein